MQKYLYFRAQADGDDDDGNWLVTGVRGDITVDEISGSEPTLDETVSTQGRVAPPQGSVASPQDTLVETANTNKVNVGKKVAAGSSQDPTEPAWMKDRQFYYVKSAAGDYYEINEDEAGTLGKKLDKDAVADLHAKYADAVGKDEKNKYQTLQVTDDQINVANEDAKKRLEGIRAGIAAAVAEKSPNSVATGGGNPFIPPNANPPIGIQDVLDKYNTGGGDGSGIGAGNPLGADFSKFKIPDYISNPPKVTTGSDPASQVKRITSGTSLEDVYGLKHKDAQTMRRAALALDPVKITGRTFYDLPKSTQDIMMAAYGDLGENPEDVLEIIKKGLPQAAGRTGSRVM